MRKEWNKFVRRNDWVPSWVRDPAVASDPIMCGLNPCVPLNSSSGGVRSGGTSPVNTDSTNSGNNSVSEASLFILISGRLLHFFGVDCTIFESNNIERILFVILLSFGNICFVYYGWLVYFKRQIGAYRYTQRKFCFWVESQCSFGFI